MDPLLADLLPIQKLSRKHWDRQFLPWSSHMYWGKKFCSEFFPQISKHVCAYFRHPLSWSSDLGITGKIDFSYCRSWVYRWCKFLSKMMTSEVKQRPRLAICWLSGQHGSQWVKWSEKILNQVRLVLWCLLLKCKLFERHRDSIIKDGWHDVWFTVYWNFKYKSSTAWNVLFFSWHF